MTILYEYTYTEFDHFHVLYQWKYVVYSFYISSIPLSIFIFRCGNFILLSQMLKISSRRNQNYTNINITIHEYQIIITTPHWITFTYLTRPTNRHTHFPPTIINPSRQTDSAETHTQTMTIIPFSIHPRAAKFSPNHHTLSAPKSSPSRRRTWRILILTNPLRFGRKSRKIDRRVPRVACLAEIPFRPSERVYGGPSPCKKAGGGALTRGAPAVS